MHAFWYCALKFHRHFTGIYGSALWLKCYKCNWYIMHNIQLSCTHTSLPAHTGITFLPINLSWELKRPIQKTIAAREWTLSQLSLPFHCVAPSLTCIYLPMRLFKVPVSWPSPPSVILPASLNNRQLERENVGQGRGKRKTHYFSFQFGTSFIHLLFVCTPLLQSIDFHWEMLCFINGGW